MPFSNSRPHSAFQYVLVLIVALLTVETFLTIHAIEHGFGEEDGLCLSCDKASKFQYSITSSASPVAFQQTRNERSVLTYQTLQDNLRTGYYPRGPPKFLNL